ncbi:putative ER to Golgi transport protein [Talaromyces proteolyticus]|uniref:ER to Golgi transport protein n=1 Tax=Talaromyces proteolyticus TaxID=1131652 RepID=A0AAD4PW39_9EURO|nr:putative ER to Golgi transport protein [Talaromyces proteolyticus]KAH8691104.1 putative ER to Golgi transport protein [Talaromyces proteolyticus]
MSTTTVTGTGRRASIRQPNWPQVNKQGPGPQDQNSPMDKFPAYVDEAYDTTPNGNQRTAHSGSEDLWQSRKAAGHVIWDPRAASKHRPRKSISETISTIRMRNSSMSANAHEIAEALRAPVSYKLIGLCLIWYMTSAVTNTSSKSILNALPKPITLTIIQFAFVSIWCMLLAYCSVVIPSLKKMIPALRNGIAPPSREVIMTAMPLAIFQLLGHILSSMATSQIPVSLVHTIKGLSPLFTVLAYRIFFRIKYARATYLSLIPLTLGVMLACSTGFSSNFFGIACALLAALVFVSQNIFSKKLFNEAARAESEHNFVGRRKMDKLNLLYYCSGLAFLFTLPIWVIAEGYPMLSDFLSNGAITLSEKKGSLDHGALFLEFVFNGVSHFAQNILAFVLLSMISPVSYSVASLIKRVFVIVVAIIWFGNHTTSTQAVGISLTFLGLYLYDRNSHDDLADQRANADHFSKRETILPLNKASTPKTWDSNGYAFPPVKPIERIETSSVADEKKGDDRASSVRPRGTSLSRNCLPPGTKQETTWQLGDTATSR